MRFIDNDFILEISEPFSNYHLSYTDVIFNSLKNDLYVKFKKNEDGNEYYEIDNPIGFSGFNIFLFKPFPFFQYEYLELFNGIDIHDDCFIISPYDYSNEYNYIYMCGLFSDPFYDLRTYRNAIESIWIKWKVYCLIEDLICPK